MEKTKIILIGGPTAVGKTSLAIKIAKLFNGEIINADSIQIYKGLNIGSAKPTNKELSEVKHHLINTVEPNKEYSVAEFKQDAQKEIEKIKIKKKLPIIVGGTGFYMKGLLFPLEFGNSFKDQKIRDKYNELVQKNGAEYVYEILKKVDPESAQTIHCNDTKRVIRALEIFEMSGEKKSAMKIDYSNSEYDYLLLFLNDDRKRLYNRIDERVDNMFDLGLIDEVMGLIKTYNLTRESQSMQAIGYKEFFDYFENKISVEQLKEKIKQDSKHYAKRQITWFKGMPKVNEFLLNQQKEIENEIKLFLNS